MTTPGTAAPGDLPVSQTYLFFLGDLFVFLVFDVLAGLVILDSARVFGPGDLREAFLAPLVLEALGLEDDGFDLAALAAVRLERDDPAAPDFRPAGLDAFDLALGLVDAAALA